MELEETIKIYNELKKYKEIIGSIDTDFFFNFVETILQAVDNYKATSYTSEYFRGVNECEDKWEKKIEDKIEELKKRYLTKPEDIQNETTVTFMYYTGMVEILQELLEDK